MGFRMSVCREIDRRDHNRWYGDDHKLYGYVSFDDVVKSFVYISRFMKAQWENLDYEIYDDPREIYDYICAVPATDYLILSEEEFKEFADLYLKDVFKNNSIETFQAVCEYMTKLILAPGNKAIWWS